MMQTDYGGAPAHQRAGDDQIIMLAPALKLLVGVLGDAAFERAAQARAHWHNFSLRPEPFRCSIAVREVDTRRR